MHRRRQPYVHRRPQPYVHRRPQPYVSPVAGRHCHEVLGAPPLQRKGERVGRGVGRAAPQLGGGERLPARRKKTVGGHGIGERVERAAARLDSMETPRRSGVEGWAHRVCSLGTQGCSPLALLWRE